MASTKSLCTKKRNPTSTTRQRRRTEMKRFSTTSTLLTLTIAALFALSYTSAFNILQSSPLAPTIRYKRIAQQQHRNGELSAAVTATSPKRSRATTLLLISPLDTHDEDDEKAVSSTSSVSKRLHSWKCWIQFWRTKTFQNLARRRNTRAAKIVATSLVSAGSVVSILGGGPAPAFARTLQDTMEEGTQIYSLRPGVSMEQAEQLSSGVMPDEVRDNIDSKTAIGATTGLSKEESVAKAKQKDTLYGDLDDYDDEDYAADEEVFGDSSYGNTVGLSKQRQKSFSSETDVSNEISKATKSSFSGTSDPATSKSNSLYAKVSLGLFIPTFGLFGVRDFVRNKKEAKNVEKALEIVDAQRAEYFGIDKDGNNITATEEDSDIEDELKDLKDGDEDDDSDDDDDDSDDDDDDEPPRRRRSLPKLPKGPEGDGSGGAGGGYDDFGDDDDGPSDDDIQRLGDIFNKS